ncbi:MAG: hypothetical protein JWM03_1017, partial [Rhodocyclales bacterium]|nr:hypothetical protein [Rhodocyclales bacterium]
MTVIPVKAGIHAKATTRLGNCEVDSRFRG